MSARSAISFRRRLTRSTYLSMIPGWCMGLRWPSSPVGRRIRDFTPTVQESLLDWGLGSDYSPAMAGVGTTGDVIGMVAGMVAGPSTTTKASPRMVECIVNRASARNDFHSTQMNQGNHSNGRSLGGHGASHAGSNLHASAARHSSASNRSGHGGIARTHSFFHSGGFHGVR